MPRFFNPKTTARPSSKFSHGVVHSARARRLVISGQVGVLADGTILPDLEGQMQAAWDNLIATLEEAGMGITDLIKITAFVTVPGAVNVFRKVRDQRLMGHCPASTYLEVSGLARPDFMFEIEGEAVVEEADMIADQWTETVARGHA
ncbi:MAG TPA: RidA family protein [Beijerinckiaceae bacterium]|nr:RidA family protein [Beijerinckiaceae bacterium]